MVQLLILNFFVVELRISLLRRKIADAFDVEIFRENLDKYLLGFVLKDGNFVNCMIGSEIVFNNTDVENTLQVLNELYVSSHSVAVFLLHDHH